MFSLKSIAAAAASASFAVSVAWADGHAPTMSMVSLMEVDPAQEEAFDDAWMTIKETAEANDYPYTEFVGGSRNMRWIVTPIENFAAVDAVFAARDAVEEAGGRKMEKALDTFAGALTNSHTFFVRYADDLSYQTDQDAGGPYMEIDTFYYRYGKQDEIKALFADYKALMEELNAPYSYNVSWDSLGTEGNSLTVITYAEDKVAMAERDAAMEALLKDNKKAEALFARFRELATGSESMTGRMNMEASINLPEGDS